MTARVRTALVVIALAVGAGACTAAAPAPSSPGAGLGRPTIEPSRLSSAEPSPEARRLGSLDLDVGVLDPDWTSPMLEFASDGRGIIFSSGVADGPEGEFAPDLWRYEPFAEEPELLWRNPRRDRSLVRIGGEPGTWAFVEIALDGSRAWDLWLLTDADAEPLLLDTHPGDEEVSSLVPSFDVHEGQIAWTAFDSGPSGPVSQLLVARAPTWEPSVVLERPAREAELWLPSLRASTLVYSEVVYAPDRAADERRVFMLDLRAPEAEPKRLDVSGLATMPLAVDGAVIWKETDPGFSMFNWGRLVRYDLETEAIAPLPMRPQEDVNYPSAGDRFVAAWGADSQTFTIHDLERRMSRYLERYDAKEPNDVLRPHVAGDLLVWQLVSEGVGGEATSELRYALLPTAGTDRDR